MSETQSFNNNTMDTQLRARKVMKGEMLIFATILIIGTLSFLLFVQKSINALIVFLLFLIAFRTVAVWYQWNFLIRFQLTCPHCNQLLAQHVQFIRSPNHICPHCGKRALVPIKQLVEYEKTHSK